MKTCCLSIQFPLTIIDQYVLELGGVVASELGENETPALGDGALRGL
jgi:hypothetical protein